MTLEFIFKWSSSDTTPLFVIMSDHLRFESKNIQIVHLLSNAKNAFTIICPIYYPCQLIAIALKTNFNHS